MKRVLAALLILLVVGLQAATARESEYYYYNVTVEKIFVCRDGYRVIYRSSGFDFHEMYLPASWFKAGGKINQIKTDVGGLNYMSIFYKNGEFSHAKLCVPPIFTDTIWQSMPSGDYSEKFNVDGIQLKF